MNKKEQARLKRHNRIKLRIRGTKEAPRVVVHRSLNHLSAQVVDDSANKTLFSFSTLSKEIRQKLGYPANVKAAGLFGEAFAAKAKEKGINRIVFDCAGYLYHGRIKAFADALRKGGLEF